MKNHQFFIQKRIQVQMFKFSYTSLVQNIVLLSLVLHVIFWGAYLTYLLMYNFSKAPFFIFFSFFRVQFFFLTYLSNKINYKKHFTLSGPNNMANYLGLAVLTLSLYVLLSIKTLALS